CYRSSMAARPSSWWGSQVSRSGWLMAEGAIRERNQLVVFALGTFHAAGLIVALVLALYAAGGLAPILSSLSTLAGLSLFSALWLSTVWSTHRTLRGAFTVAPWTSVPLGIMIPRPAWRGGITGVGSLACLGLV